MGGAESLPSQLLGLRRPALAPMGCQAGPGLGTNELEGGSQQASRRQAAACTR